jgi:hypothetical protein
MLRNYIYTAVISILLSVCSASKGQDTTLLSGQVVDSDTGKLLACRIYICDENGKWYFPKSTSPNGSAVVYQKQNRANKNSVEMHTTLSADPFAIKLPRGKYKITVERGKEYFPKTKSVNVGSEPVKIVIRLKRWINMAELGWYSGDTHVHRTLEELPNVQLAEDLNVSFPLLYWVTKAYQPPGTGDKSTNKQTEPRLIFIDKTHVIYPLNTEYEIFSVNGKSHTLGAFFILNHKSVFQDGVPPVSSIAERSRWEDGLLELDKHNWPWSMMLVPVMNIDLFELSNNHIWRTEFAFTKFGEGAPAFMEVETDAKGFTERGWIEYGFNNYYTLLNCGFNLRPTAGTASGVHPVPLGFGRVYVKLKDGFDYDMWMRGLDKGRSFVTTGPMLFVTVNGFEAGHVFRQSANTAGYTIAGTASSMYPLECIEIVVNGRVVRKIKAENAEMSLGGYCSTLNEKINIDNSSWIAIRCYERQTDGRVRFAHTGVFHVKVEGRPLQVRKVESDFLIKRMRRQIKRNEGVLPEKALDEYRKALEIYQKIAKAASNN